MTQLNSVMLIVVLAALGLVGLTASLGRIPRGGASALVGMLVIWLVVQNVSNVIGMGSWQCRRDCRAPGIHRCGRQMASGCCCQRCSW